MKGLYRYPKATHGFTLVELVLVVIIGAILVTIALRSAATLSDTARVEQTKQELDRLAEAIVGNPTVESGGIRSDFGYVGDIGALPANLDQLLTNPGYATWNGPYVRSAHTQASDDYKTDSWGTAYQYSGGVSISSTGSGSPITKSFAASSTELLSNRVTGLVCDLDGTPPGPQYRDSIIVRLVVPNGLGSFVTRDTTPQAGGNFGYSGVPIGNHDLLFIYQPLADTIRRYISVLPGSQSYAACNLSLDLWTGPTGGGGSGGAGGGGGGLIKVPGSDTISGDDCEDISFWVQNTTSGSIGISSITATWTSPVAFYESIRFGSYTVYNQRRNRARSGEQAPFNRTRSVAAGATLKIQLRNFRATETGSSSLVNMQNATLNIALSNGSVVVVTLGACSG